MSKQRGYVVYPDDNVGTALTPLTSGEIELLGEGKEVSIRILQEVPYGHKFALREIAPGTPIIKYGACIGSATMPIHAGEHVHLHNMRSNFDERASTLDVETAIPKGVEYKLYWEGET